MNQVWPYPGARWWKFDFHTHTPASKDTTAWQDAKGTVNELTPQTWLLKYMAAEIDCVAVTDHNSGEWIDKLKSAYSDMIIQADAGNPPLGFRELYLFPGVEISVQGGFHLLAIFDCSATSQTISDLLAKVDYDGTRGDSDGVTREGAAKVLECVLAQGGLAIPAHVDGSKGLLQVESGTNKCFLDTTTVKQVLQVPGILAMEWTSQNSTKPKVMSELKLDFTSVVGSDCHSFQGRAVPGSRFTWIKMAKPSLEGLRLALLDEDISVLRSDDNIDFSPFNTPEHFIESIQISDARFMGRGNGGAAVPLNPYFNALIGGRGTGKSTIVHALRLAYRREKELMPLSEAGQTFARFNKVAKTNNDEGGLRSDSAVCINVHRDGALYRLRWRQEGERHVVEEYDATTSDFKSSDSQVITEQRFPLRLFSQGQIAALAGDSQQALLRVIDDAAGTRVKQDAVEDAKRVFMVTRARMRELQGKILSRESINLSLQDVQRKLSRFESTDHAAILKKYQQISSQEQEIERQFEATDTLADQLKNLSADLLPESLPDGLFDTHNDRVVLEVVQQLKLAVEKVSKEVERAANDLKSQGSSLKNKLEADPWFTLVREAKAAYEKLKADLQEQGVSDPSEYGRLVQEKLRLETELTKLDEQQKQHDALREKALFELEQVLIARREISDQRKAFLNATLSSNPYVRIELIAYSRDVKSIERSLRETLGTTEGKYAEDLYAETQNNLPAKGLLADLIIAADFNDKPGLWDPLSFEKSIKTLKKRLVNACNGNGDFGGWFNKFLQGQTEQHPEYIDHILCWFPEDGLQVEYSRKGDGKNFQSIGQASAGQRAAAMLAFLLAHGNEPLVLDQPEDDLDNHLIYGLVVQQIRSNKLRRQLIIVTHNPNIVVNGDAELIHVLDFNNQCYLKKSGSLQDQVMRKEVCQVMEGGEEAFERRYKRLGKES